MQRDFVRQAQRFQPISGGSRDELGDGRSGAQQAVVRMRFEVGEAHNPMIGADSLTRKNAHMF